LNCPVRGRKMTNNCLHTVNPYISSKHHLYTLLPCTRVSISHPFFYFAQHETKQNNKIVSRNFAYFAKQ
jgi:hypothetical protein